MRRGQSQSFKKRLSSLRENSKSCWSSRRPMSALAKKTRAERQSAQRLSLTRQSRKLPKPTPPSSCWRESARSLSPNLKKSVNNFLSKQRKRVRLSEKLKRDAIRYKSSLIFFRTRVY